MDSLCNCSVDDDEDITHMAGLFRRALNDLASTSALAKGLGELEATDHDRLCLSYSILLEACERAWIGMKP